MRYWLMKSEPSEFSLEDLKRRPGRTGGWDGVRNYQARNNMRDGMKLGDRVLFYHSSVKVPAIVGVATVAREAYPDASAWDPRSDYHDPKASPEKPIWVMVDVKFEAEFPRPVTLPEMRALPALQDMFLIRKGMRLSVQPVTPEEFDAIVRAAHSLPPGGE
jgi:predicted RNA-binding protein with PUA-like domain